MTNFVDHHRFAFAWSVALTVATAACASLIWWLVGHPWFWSWLLGASMVSAAAFWYDKSASRREGSSRRIRMPEYALLWSCLIGGTLGAIVVMLGRRHKTIDYHFLLVLGIITGLQLGIIGSWMWGRLTAP